MRAPRGLPICLCLACVLLWTAGCASTPEERPADTLKSDVSAILQKPDRPTTAVLAQLDAQLRWIFERRLRRDDTPAQEAQD